MWNITWIQGVIFISLCLVSSIYGQCKVKAGTEDAKNCQEGDKVNQEYQDLKVADDIYEVYPNLLQNVSFGGCEKSCKPGSNPKQKTTCTSQRVLCTDDPCDKLKKNRAAFLKCLDGLKPKSRRKRQEFNDEHWWKCDFPVRSCCKTCRRTIMMIEPLCIKYRSPRKKKCNDWVYPVFCPKKGGFQLKDDIECIQQNCRKPCRKETTFYSFLVTSIPYDGWGGHCKQTWMAVWFKTKELPSHCTCPREGKA